LAAYNSNILPYLFLLFLYCFQDSLELQRQELVDLDNTVQVNVIRHQGYYGDVTVKWVATGDHDGTNDITPLEGVVSTILQLSKFSLKQERKTDFVNC